MKKKKLASQAYASGGDFRAEVPTIRKVLPALAKGAGLQEREGSPSATRSQAYGFIYWLKSSTLNCAWKQTGS